VRSESAKLSPIPLTARIATPGACSNLDRWQSGTVYKSVPNEAAAAAAVADRDDQGHDGEDKRHNEPRRCATCRRCSGRDLGDEGEPPDPIFTSRFLMKKDVCTGEFAKYC